MRPCRGQGEIEERAIHWGKGFGRRGDPGPPGVGGGKDGRIECWTRGPADHLPRDCPRAAGGGRAWPTPAPSEAALLTKCAEMLEAFRRIHAVIGDCDLADVSERPPRNDFNVACDLVRDRRAARSRRRGDPGSIWFK